MFCILYAVPAAAPGNFTINVASSTSAVFSWLPLDPADQNGLITQYMVNITNTDLGTSSILVVPGSNTSVELTTLKPYTSYLCSVAATTSIGSGPYTVGISITTAEDGKCNYSDG